MLASQGSYPDLYRTFKWRIPEFFNMGVDVCDKHASTRPNRTALIVEEGSGEVTRYTFRDIRQLSNRLANLFRANGLKKGDRIGILLSQSLEALIGHVAAWKAGLISFPLSTLFGEDALEFRLANSGACSLITNGTSLPKVEAVRRRLPNLQSVLVTEPITTGKGVVDLWEALGEASDRFEPVKTRCDEPAIICYTSGTTGNPKGTLHAHRVLLGHIPGVELPHEFFPQAGDLFWTPADWAWMGGLMNAVMPSLHHGVPVLAHRGRKFDPEFAFKLMARHNVKNSFMPPTALKLMRQVDRPKDRFSFDLRTVAVAGEPMGGELLEWGRSVLGITFNEFFGQTECNLVLTNCAKIMEVKPGSMGRPVPGHQVEVIDGESNPLAPGEMGSIAVRQPDPVMFLEYWKNPEATSDTFQEDWLLTGDQGYRDEQGYFYFLGRDDDLITSAGYRIGPSEIEDCLMKHPAVAMVAVIGVPDEVRTQVVKAYIVLRPRQVINEGLEKELQDLVKTRLSPHVYPRLIECVKSLPMTTTGKIKRRDLRERENQH